MIALADLGAFVEQPLLQKGGEAGDDVDPIDRLDPSQKLAGLGDRPPGRFHDADCGWPGGGRLGLNPAGRDRQETSSPGDLPTAA